MAPHPGNEHTSLLPHNEHCETSASSTTQNRIQQFFFMGEIKELQFACPNHIMMYVSVG
jgi:hypothetical protein